MAKVITSLPWIVQSKTVSDIAKISEKTTKFGMESGETLKHDKGRGRLKISCLG